MTILQISEHCYLAILKFHGAIYSATATTQRAAHCKVLGVVYGD